MKTVENINLKRLKTTFENGCQSCYFNEEGLPCQAPPDFPLRCFGASDGNFYIYVKMSSSVKELRNGEDDN